MTINEAIKAIKAYRGPIYVDSQLTADDYAWIQVVKADLLFHLKAARDAGVRGEYSLDDGHFLPY